MIHILFIYYINAAHVAASIMCLAVVYLNTLGSMSFLMAQTVAMAAWMAATTLFILGTSISVVKILYVTHFDLIFNQDQEVMSSIVVGLSLLAGCLPHLVICIHLTLHRMPVIPAEAYFMGEKIKMEAVSPTMVYGSVWLALNMLLLVFAMLFIRKFEKTRQTTADEEGREAAGKSVSLARVFLGVSGLIVIGIQMVVTRLYGRITDFPLQLVLQVLVICGMLLAFVLERKILEFCHQTLSDSWVNMKGNWRALLGCQETRVNPA